MRKYAFSCVVFVILALQMGPLTDAQADVVGRLTQVEGRVDILKGGQLPATPVKVDDGVQPGDVLRTKSLSKAQITFIDNSTMTIAPESRVAIEAYMFDAAQNKRNAVIELFKGLAHVVVSKVYQSAEPDFVVKTQTAIMGIRGTDFGIRLQPNSTDILNFEGRLQVGNIYPEVGQLPQRAFKVAYAFGSGPGSHWVFLDAMMATSVAAGLPPTRGYKIYDEDKRHFFNQVGTGLNICRRNPEAGEEETGGGPPSESISGCAPTTGLSGSDIGNIELVSAFFGSYFTPPYTPPNSPPLNETPPPNPSNGGSQPTPPPTYNFSLCIYGLFLQSACNTSGSTGFLTANAYNGGGGSPVLLNSGGLGLLVFQGDLAGVFPSLYLATDSSTFAPTSGTFPKSKLLAGVYTGNIVGSVSGIQGAPLTGNATLNSSYISYFWFKKYTLSNNATILVTIDPSGKITYSYVDGSFEVVVGGTAVSGGTSSGNGTANPLIPLVTDASTPEASGTMLATAASTGSTGSTENNLSEATGTQPSGSNNCSVTNSTSRFTGRGAHSNSFGLNGDGRKLKHDPAITRPMAGHHQGPGPGPNPPNFILSNVITNPAMHCLRNFPVKPGILPAGITDHREGHQAVHHRKHKPEGNPGHSPGGQVNAAFQGGAPGNHQGPMTGPSGSKPGGGRE
jgi:hypothetical protein